MLFGVILGLSGFFKTREEGKALIDDFPFRLCYTFTCGILFLSSILVGLQDLVGNNIDCIRGNKVVNQYCWITGTHLLIESDDERGLGSYYYGEDKCLKNADGFWVTPGGASCVKTHSYYQWVPYILVIQGMIFFLPRLFWQHFEQQKMSTISEGVRTGSTTAKGDKLKNVATNVANYINLDEAGHTSYGLAYTVSQAMNLLALILAFSFSDHVLDKQFRSIGFRWLSALMDPNQDSTMILYKTFPRLSKCEFQKFGTGGDLEVNEYLCVLTPNIISEKIFVFLWFWYVILGLILAINLILVLLMAFKSPRVRSWFMMRAVFSRKVKGHIKSSERLKKKLESMEFGKFLFLYLLGRNVEYFVYKRILELVSEGTEGAHEPSITEDLTRGAKLTRELSRPDVQDSGCDEMRQEPLPAYPIFTQISEDASAQTTITSEFQLHELSKK